MLRGLASTTLVKFLVQYLFSFLVLVMCGTRRCKRWVEVHQRKQFLNAQRKDSDWCTAVRSSTRPGYAPPLKCRRTSGLPVECPDCQIVTYSQPWSTSRGYAQRGVRCCADAPPAKLTRVVTQRSDALYSIGESKR